MCKESRGLNDFVLSVKKQGAKVSSKINLLVKILPLIDHLLIAGGMARIGNYILDSYKKKSLREKVHVYLPINVIIAHSMNNDANIKEQFAKKNTIAWRFLDIGRKFITVINRSHGSLTLRGRVFCVEDGDSILSLSLSISIKTIKKYKYRIIYISPGGASRSRIYCE